MWLMVNGRAYEVQLVGTKAAVNGKELSVEEEDGAITVGGKKFFIDYSEEGDPALFIVNGIACEVAKGASGKTNVKEILAPISGRITELNVKEREEVSEGQVLLVLEAMKMENQIKSPRSGKISKVTVAKGASVRAGEVLIGFE